jgi:hypothetical protein
MDVVNKIPESSTRRYVAQRVDAILKGSARRDIFALLKVVCGDQEAKDIFTHINAGNFI